MNAMTRLPILALAAAAVALAALAGGPAPAADAQIPPANFYGAGLDPGAVVTASIGGAACGSSTVDAGGEWAIEIPHGACGGGAVSGAVVSFAIDGVAATPAATWRFGGLPDDPSAGIALTLPSAAFNGGGLEAGDAVTATIGGVECGRTEADAGGEWSIVVAEGGCGGAAADGATVSFTVNGAVAEQTATWRAGGVSNGIALTVALAATFYGGGLEAGDVVTASIGGVECGRTEADESGGWSIVIPPGACGGGAVDGAAVAFAIDGRAAAAEAAWRSGGQPDDVSSGITLTVAPAATFYGGGLEAGAVVIASIGGVECGRAEADAGGGWSIVIPPGACGGGAVDGAVVAFAIDGRAATAEATWRSGGLPDDVENGIALTVAGTTIGLQGARAVYVLDSDRAFASYVVGAPDFVNAAFAGRWVAASGAAATPPTLTLDIEGARAVYVLGADGVFASYVVGAPEFVNAAFVQRWIVGAPG